MFVDVLTSMNSMLFLSKKNNFGMHSCTGTLYSDDQHTELKYIRLRVCQSLIFWESSENCIVLFYSELRQTMIMNFFCNYQDRILLLYNPFYLSYQTIQEKSNLIYVLQVVSFVISRCMIAQLLTITICYQNMNTFYQEFSNS